MDDILLILAWFTICMWPCFDCIWSGYRVMWLELVWMFFIFFIFLIYFSASNLFLVKTIWVFLFLKFDSFKFWFHFLFRFLVEPSSWLSLWLDQRFQVNPVRSKLGQRLRPYLPGNVFAKGFVWLKGVFGKHPLSLF
jgi:hypothetical protein